MPHSRDREHAFNPEELYTAGIIECSMVASDFRSLHSNFGRKLPVFAVFETLTNVRDFLEQLRPTPSTELPKTGNSKRDCLFVRVPEERVRIGIGAPAIAQMPLEPACGKVVREWRFF